MREEVACTETPFIDLIRDTWPLFQDNWKISVGVAAILSYVPFIVVGIPFCALAFIVGVMFGFVNKGLIFPAMIPIGFLGVIAFAVAYNLVRVGWTRIMLKLVRGESATFSDLKQVKPWWVNFVILHFIIGVGTFLGGWLLIVPGVLFFIRTCFAPFLLIEENLTPVEAIMRSNDLVTGYSWQILGYFCFYFIANIVASSLPVAGLLLQVASMGFFDLTLARLYDYRRRITET